VTEGEGWRTQRCTEADKSLKNIGLCLRPEEVYPQFLSASLGGCHRASAYVPVVRENGKQRTNMATAHRNVSYEMPQNLGSL
jgi:hypothetical protein